MDSSFFFYFQFISVNLVNNNLWLFIVLFRICVHLKLAGINSFKFFLAYKGVFMVNDELLLVHRQRNDGQSILHVAVLGENFGLLSSLFQIKC